MKKSDKPTRDYPLATMGLPEETELVVARASKLTSLDSLMQPVELNREEEERLPLLLLQQTAVAQTAWAHIAKTLRIIRDTRVWERIDGGKYKGDFDGFLTNFTSGMDYSPGRVSNLLGYYNWFETNLKRITDAKPDESPYNEPQIPRERTMRLVMQYHEAFEENPRLLEMVFWRGNIDHDYLLAEITSLKGESYVASRQSASFKSRQLGGKMSRPTFGPASRSRTDADKVIANAIDLLSERLYNLIVEQRLYTKMDSPTREQFRQRLEGITESVLAVEGVYSK